MDKLCFHFLSECAEDGKWIQDLIDQSAQLCLFLLESNASHPTMVLNAVSFIVIAFGSKIHRTPILNQILNIIETQFNASKVTFRSLAFKTWRRLILNFNLKSHLFHVKRVDLILIPLWNGLKYEKNESVYEECVDTFTFLLMILSQKQGHFKLIRDILKKSFCSELLVNSTFTTHLISISSNLFNVIHLLI